MRFALAGLVFSLSAPAMAANIAIFDDLYGTPWSGTAATNLGHSVLVYYRDGASFSNACASADLCIIESPNYGSDPTAVAAISSAVGAGKPVIVEYWKFGSDPAFNSALQISATDYYTPFGSIATAGSQNFFSGFGGTLFWPGSYDAGINGSTFTLPSGGFIAANPAVIAVTNGGRSIANGYLSFDFQNADRDADGKLDVVEIYEAEIAFLLSGGGPQITLTGSPCPSSVTVAARGFTPNRAVAVVRANVTGAAVVPSGACAGTVMGLGTSGLQLVTMATANGSGAINWSGSVGAGLCGKYFQLVDMATCRTSNVDQF